MRCPANRYVFRFCLNCSGSTAGSRRWWGNCLIIAVPRNKIFKECYTWLDHITSAVCAWQLTFVWKLLWKFVGHCSGATVYVCQMLSCASFYTLLAHGGMTTRQLTAAHHQWHLPHQRDSMPVFGTNITLVFYLAVSFCADSGWCYLPKKSSQLFMSNARLLFGST